MIKNRNDKNKSIVKSSANDSVNFVEVIDDSVQFTCVYNGVCTGKDHRYAKSTDCLTPFAGLCP